MHSEKTRRICGNDSELCSVVRFEDFKKMYSFHDDLRGMQMVSGTCCVFHQHVLEMQAFAKCDHIFERNSNAKDVTNNGTA